MQGKEGMKTRRSLKYRTARNGRGGERKILRCLSGFPAALMILLAASLAAACLVEKGVVSAGKSGIAGKLCFAAASLAGCWIAARKAQKKLLYAAMTGCGLLILMSLGAAAAGEWGELRLWTPLAITAASILIGAVLGAKRRGNGYG